ncbi:MAG: AraC family transcriptional regulator [Synergistaceae bacterium]|jgi:AraC-like DNA-binding protein|nr:AraC family transcriptional regulator [Synergistaceae bacterium]
MSAALPIVINDISDDSIYLIYAPAYAGLPFLATGVGHFKANPGYYVERDCFNMCLILFGEAGIGSLSYRNRDIEILPQQAVLINGTEYHKYHTSLGCNSWHFKWVRFSSQYFMLYDALINQGNINAIDISDTTIDEQHTAILSRMEGGHKLKDLILSNMIQNMLTTLCMAVAHPPRQYDMEENRSMETCRKYILENYASQLTIDELAKISGLGKYSFIRKFRKYMGVSPYTYLQKIRINNAIALLEASEKSICEISGTVGFGDQNNFAKQFKLNTGMTPTQYRRQFRTSLTSLRTKQGF